MLQKYDMSLWLFRWII